MIVQILNNFFQLFIGFSSGIAVGSGFVAFITVLGVIPRLLQIANALHFARSFGYCATLGAIFGTYLSFTTQSINVFPIVLVAWGLFHGIFVGMLAAALTEVLNVFPILLKRLRMDSALFVLLSAVVLGKIFGSLFQWLFLNVN